MSRGYSSNTDCKVYVGDLATGVSREDLEDVFNPFGYLKSVWVARNPPGFAFIEFEDSRDARDAVKEVDGTRICGREVKVELSSGRSRRGGGGGGGGYGRGPPRRDIRNESCYACGERGHFARDCSMGRRPGDGQRNGRGRDNYRDNRRSYRSRSRSRSKSPQRRRRYSRSPSAD